ncbi:ribonuclease HI family protein [Agrococcus sp. HG114]|uniref:ribonuclease HI family protein n=1 Tax=Agrococcus sp. HG114 TaxID=2969757 RepID=UPI00215B4808|nr:ribonuclease HI family protein [Agrococcus sp. HG114]MCR8671327.1 ribonuclease HI family protein [Agrococcus sp. HG114]
MITAAADGSSLGNPGPTGWGWYIDDERWAAGGQATGTNNIGELSAVVDLLRQTRGVDELLILCDSQYVINSVTKWMAGWKRKGWRKADGKPVLNRELLEELDRLMAERGAEGGVVRFEWVRGHAGHPLNEAADRLANGAAAAYQRGMVPDAGPGFGGPAPSAAPTRGTAAATVPADAPPASAPASAERPAPAPSQTPGLFDDLDFLTDTGDEAEVVRLERSLLSDDVRADPASVAALLHPEFEEIGASGRRWSRDEVLAEIAPLRSPLELEVLATHELPGDALLLVWRSVGESSALRSSLWVRSDGRWRQRFHQATPEA